MPPDVRFTSRSATAASIRNRSASANPRAATEDGGALVEERRDPPAPDEARDAAAARRARDRGRAGHARLGMMPRRVAGRVGDPCASSLPIVHDAGAEGKRIVIQNLETIDWDDGPARASDHRHRRADSLTGVAISPPCRHFIAVSEDGDSLRFADAEICHADAMIPCPGPALAVASAAFPGRLSVRCLSLAAPAGASPRSTVLMPLHTAISPAARGTPSKAPRRPDPGRER